MKIIITGIKGFLGSYLFNDLKDEHEIIGIDAKNGKIESTIIYDSKKIDSIDFEPDVVIICHAAVASGSDQVDNNLLYDVNVNVTEKVVSKFYSSKLIFISSVSIFKTSDNIVSEASEIDPQSEYALSKLWAEKIVLKSKNAAVLRFSSLFGIGMKENTLIPNYVNQALKEKQINVWGDGSRKQNYININDAVFFINRVLNQFREVNGKILLGVSPNEFSNSEIASIVASETNSEVRFVKSDSSKSFKYNNFKTLELLNWKPQLKTEEYLKEYIQWKVKQS